MDDGKGKTQYVVRYGAMRFLGIFEPTKDRAFSRGDDVIVRTHRGLEAALVLDEVNDRNVAFLDSTDEGVLLRAMTAEDARELERIHRQEKDEFTTCERIIGRMGLEMNLVSVEHIFGGERIIVYYLADGRVDFRELVKVLAGEFQTRIEMRQIGVRDEAKLLADFGDCGKPVCCNNHLVQMPPVSMKMAKRQKATLDPTKISGRCGRLKCCLRYEYDLYREAQNKLPPIGAHVEIPGGSGRVVGHEVLSEKVLVENRERVRRLIALSDVHVLPPRRQGADESGDRPKSDRKPRQESERPARVAEDESVSREGRQRKVAPTDAEGTPPDA